MAGATAALVAAPRTTNAVTPARHRLDGGDPDRCFLAAQAPSAQPATAAAPAAATATATVSASSESMGAAASGRRLPPAPCPTVDRLAGGALDVLERERMHASEEDRIVGGWPVPHASDRLVVGVHVVPGEAAGGRGPAVVLVEGRLAEEHDELDAVEVARPPVQVVVREPAARERRTARRARRAPSTRPRRANRLLLSPIGPNRPRLDEPPGVLIRNSSVAVVLPRDASPAGRPRPPGRSRPRAPACAGRSRGGRRVPSRAVVRSTSPRAGRRRGGRATRAGLRR